MAARMYGRTDGRMDRRAGGRADGVGWGSSGGGMDGQTDRQASIHWAGKDHHEDKAVMSRDEACLDAQQAEGLVLRGAVLQREPVVHVPEQFAAWVPEQLVEGLLEPLLLWEQRRVGWGLEGGTAILVGKVTLSYPYPIRTLVAFGLGFRVV